MGLFGLGKKKEEVKKECCCCSVDVESVEKAVSTMGEGASVKVLGSGCAKCNELEARNYSDFKKEIIRKKIKDRKEYKAIKSEYVSSLLLRSKKYYNKY